MKSEFFNHNCKLSYALMSTISGHVPRARNGSDDCGLFAVAYATAVCYGKKPEKYIFDQDLKKRHLLIQVAGKYLF